MSTTGDGYYCCGTSGNSGREDEDEDISIAHLG
jgi:hypothetical protein